ncbi:MAG: OB-fold nucleic acid binding domain-containing protein [Nanoarchaeota archaeon]
MAEFKKRETAYKLKIGDILTGTPIVEDVPQDAAPDATQTASTVIKERFRFLELGDKRVIRVNIIGNVVDKYSSDGEKRYATVTIDDASGQIRLKVFGEDTEMLSDLSHGDTILVIGVIRSYNRELYILPELVKKADPRYLLVRKLELDKKAGKKKVDSNKPEKALETRDEIIELIRAGSEAGGVNTEDIILKVKSATPETINSEIMKLLEDGMIYEPRPGKVRWLG